MGVEIGRLKACDATAVGRLVGLAIAEIFDEGVASEVLYTYLSDWNDGDLAEWAAYEGRVVLVALDGDEIVGTVIGMEPQGGVATILWLVVDPSRRREGIGRRLFGAVCDAYRVAGCHKLKLAAPDVGVHRFYLGCGMGIEGFAVKHWWKHDFWMLGMELGPWGE